MAFCILTLHQVRKETVKAPPAIAASVEMAPITMPVLTIPAVPGSSRVPFGLRSSSICRATILTTKAKKSASGLAEIRARGGKALVITDSTKDISADAIVRVETKLEHLAPMVFNVVQQLLAYYVAVERGNDVDQPRNLAKSVTVE